MSAGDEIPARPLDAEAIVRALNQHEVDYVVVGGVAIQAHGHLRTTQDLDVVVPWTQANLERLAAALRSLRARLRGVDADLLGIDPGDPRDLLAGGNFLMTTDHGDLDVFAIDQTPGAPATYDELRSAALEIEFEDVRITVAGVDHLIRMKLEASRFRDRPEHKRRQDLDDIAVLTRAQRAD